VETQVEKAAQQQYIRVEVEEGLGWVRFDRPDRMNAIGRASRAQLGAALKQVEHDDSIRCVVLIGSGRAFSAGADVKEMAEDGGEMRSPEDVGRVLRDEYMPMVLRIRNMAKPVIAALNGVAAGIGASFALAADIRIAVPDASIVEAFVGIALAPDGGATWLLPRLVGTGKALEMFFTGRPMTAVEAERSGLVNQIVEPDEFEQTVRAIATRLASGPTRAIAAAKRAVNRGLECSLEEAMEFESYLQEAQAAGDDFREGVAAFVGKRAPVFRGR
jgi:2-(1,2-epoxy-1,2-dihydrophenyl)acetyl-CoA isomerase